MKKCNQIKELILTDYIDGQLDQTVAGNLENHLLDCADCRAFFREVKARAVLLKEIQPVPAELWSAVQERLGQEASIQGQGNFLDALKAWLVLPKLVPLALSFMLMLVVGSISMDTIQLNQAQEKDRGEYLASLMGQNEPAPSLENTDLGGSIEHYFL